ncbi:hypothetical protein [Mesorhizobium sp.]|uniref:hypothetical protein n=1 Tax=Mesorhizobium sp. TaxID=1871066 RepID=UPI0025C36D86|nr:hypothetical protein [Mesorhizobium sp.]
MGEWLVIIVCVAIFLKVKQLSLPRWRDVQFGLFDDHDEIIAARFSQASEAHQQDECLERDNSVAVPQARKRWTSCFLKMRHDGVQHALTVGRRESKA